MSGTGDSGMTCALIQSNAEAPQYVTDELVAAVQDVLSHETGRPASYIMACYERVQSLFFGGSDMPAAYIEVQQIAETNQRYNKDISEKLADKISSFLGIEQNRVYVVFYMIKPANWGFNGSTF